MTADECQVLSTVCTYYYRGSDLPFLTFSDQAHTGYTYVDSGKTYTHTNDSLK